MQGRSPVGRGLLTMKKSPAALERRPSNSQQQIISSSGVHACAKQRSTCTCLYDLMFTTTYTCGRSATTPQGQCSCLLSTLGCL